MLYTKTIIQAVIDSNILEMLFSKNGFEGISAHNIFEILPANIEENHQFCRYWNATVAIQRISRAAHAARLIVSIVILP